MTNWTAEELLDLDANFVRVDGVRAVKLREIREGVYRALRMPGCSLGTYFMVLTYLHDRGYEYWDWNVYPGNPEGTSIPADRIVSGILEKVEDNDSSIILLHDTGAKNTTVEALPAIIEKIQAMDNTVILPITEDITPIQHVSLTETNGD